MCQPNTRVKPKIGWLAAMRMALDATPAASAIGYDHNLDPRTGKALPPILPPVPLLLNVPGHGMYQLMPRDWVPAKGDRYVPVPIDASTTQLWRKVT